MRLRSLSKIIFFDKDKMVQDIIKPMFQIKD